MPTKLEQARDLLANRLEELDGEREQLIAAIAQLDAPPVEQQDDGPRHPSQARASGRA